MKRESIQFGNLLLEDWGSAGCKITMLNPAQPDESIAQPLSHEQSARLCCWLIASALLCCGAFGRKLTLACAKHGAFAKLARDLGIEYMRLRHWGYGNNLPPDVYVERIAQILGWDEADTVQMVLAERIATGLAAKQDRDRPDPCRPGAGTVA